MEEFAIDLDKVLDEFEKSEDSIPKRTIDPHKFNPVHHFYLPSQPPSTLYLPEDNENQILPPSYLSNTNKKRDFLALSTSYDHHEKLDLSAADFSASKTSFNLTTSSTTTTSTISTALPELTNNLESLKLIDSQVSISDQPIDIPILDTSPVSLSTVPNVSTIYKEPLFANGLDQMVEDVLTVHLNPRSDLPNEDNVEIPLLSEGMDLNRSNDDLSYTKYVVHDPSPFVYKDRKLSLNEETNESFKTEDKSAKVLMNDALNCDNVSEDNLILKNNFPISRVSDIEPDLIPETIISNSPTDFMTNIDKPWSNLNLISDLDLVGNVMGMVSNQDEDLHSQPVGFGARNVVEMSTDELDGYLRDLEEIDLPLNAATNSDETNLALDNMTALMEGDIPLTCSTDSSEDELEMAKTMANDATLPSYEAATFSTNMGGARPKIKDGFNKKPSHNEASSPNNSNRRESQNKFGMNKSKPEIYSNELCVNSTPVKSQINGSTESLNDEESPYKNKADNDSFSDISISPAEEEKIVVEIETFQITEKEVNDSLGSVKLTRPTSLYLPAPVLVSQNQMPSPVVVVAEEIVEAVITDASPALSETDSALPPSPEAAGLQDNAEEQSLLDEEIKEPFLPNDGNLTQLEDMPPDVPLEPIIENTNSIPEEVVNPAEISLESFIPELTEDEQLLGKIKPFWIPDEEAPNCLRCESKFTVLKRRHHCRGCGKVLCSQCCSAKARIAYLDDKEARVCSPCLDTLNKVSAIEKMYNEDTKANDENLDLPGNSADATPNSGTPSPSRSPQRQGDVHSQSIWPPNPNNPQEYCSQVSPLQQAQIYSARPPPVVMVPVGVLKRGDKPKREPKQVMFSDGIRPGGDLTELDLPLSPEPKLPGHRSGGRSTRRIVDKTSPVAPLRSPQHPQSPQATSSPTNSESSTSYRRSKSHNSGRMVIYDDEGPLPPVILPLPNLEYSVNEKPDAEKLFQCLQDDTAKPVLFALTKNLMVSIKLIKLDCCLHKECWVFASKGLNSVGQDEVMVLLERVPDEKMLPRDVFLLFTALYDNASMGNPVNELGHLLFPEGLLGSRDHGAFLFLRPTYQCLSKLHLPQSPYLVALLLQKWEVPWAKVFPLRLLLRIGAEFRYYPCPLVSVRFRKPVFGEIGHTIMSVLADFRNYQYTLPTIPGVMVCMEDKKTTVCFPHNRYSQVMRVVGSSNEHVLGLGASFSLDADSHLVCVQDEEGNYQTQAINIQNTARKVTGASFIVFSGALKSTTGLTAKSSIVEDGLLVQITAETMIALKSSFQQMKDFVINCGQIDAATPEEQVVLKWVEDDRNFNMGVRSPIDGQSLEGVESMRIHSGTDYYADRHLIRWTEVFFLATDALGRRKGEPADPSKLADAVAQACCLALVSHLGQLAEAELSVVGLRVILDSEKVGYEIGAKEEPLPPLYMVDLDTALIPVITSATTNNSAEGGSLTLELLFHVLRK